MAAGLEHHQAGRHAEAEQCYAEALAIHAEEATALYLMGVLAFETGRPDEAAHWLQTVCDLRPRNMDARFTLAQARHWRGDLDLAIGAYRVVADADPTHAGALVGLANALREAGQGEAALDAARAAVSRHPNSADAQCAFAASLTAAGQSLAAASAWREAIRAEPARAAAHVGLALALIQAGDAEAALSAAEAVLDVAPADAQAFFAKGAALSAANRPSEAAAVLDLSLAIDPNRPAALVALGVVLAELEDVAGAEQRLKAAIALDPAMAEAYANLGAVYLLSDRPAAARTAYEQALAIDPEMIAAHQSLAGLLADAGEAEESRRHRDRAYRGQSTIVEHAVRPERRVLVLTTAEGGNTPFRFLLPKARYTRINWFVEYATPDQAAALPAYDIVFNVIGDPDLSGPTEANVAAFLKDCAEPVLNDPAKIARTARHLAPSLFEGLADVVVPRVTRASGDLAVAADKAGIGYPLLVRPTGSHGGKGLKRIETRDALVAECPASGESAYLTAFHDFASADGLWRKYRMIFVDRVAYPYHLAISPSWMVHHGTAGMAEDAARKAEEMAFLEDPETALGARAMAAVRAIGERMDLDFAGLDFALAPDGQVLLFEANATMLVHPEPASGPFAHKNPYVQRILDAFTAMVASR